MTLFLFSLIEKLHEEAVRQGDRLSTMHLNAKYYAKMAETVASHWPWKFRSQRNSKKAQLGTSRDSHINYEFPGKPVYRGRFRLGPSLSGLTPSILSGGCRTRNKGEGRCQNFLALSRFLVPRAYDSRLWSKTNEGRGASLHWIRHCNRPFAKMAAFKFFFCLDSK